MCKVTMPWQRINILDGTLSQIYNSKVSQGAAKQPVYTISVETNVILEAFTKSLRPLLLNFSKQNLDRDVIAKLQLT